jgi:hypothetical protein
MINQTWKSIFQHHRNIQKPLKNLELVIEFAMVIRDFCLHVDVASSLDIYDFQTKNFYKFNMKCMMNGIEFSNLLFIELSLIIF